MGRLYPGDAAVLYRGQRPEIDAQRFVYPKNPQSTDLTRLYVTGYTEIGEKIDREDEIACVSEVL